MDTPKIIAADMPILTDRYPIANLLHAFRSISAGRPDVKLVIAGKRQTEETFSIWNFIDENRLVDKVDYLPYYDRCELFPRKKSDCNVWIDRYTPPDQLTENYLLGKLTGALPPGPKRALFVTSFHPEKQEGNSCLMRIWLRHLKRAGYQVHLVYYMYDVRDVTSDMRREALRQYDRYVEVEVSSKLTGSNRNGLNVHVDDWCGPEVLDAISRLTSQFEYDIAITNYPFMTAVFQRVAAYTKTILLTHDSFTDRNRRMIAQGYGESGWISLDESGERLACERSEVIVALQQEEAEYFRSLSDDPSKVRVISPLVPRRETRQRTFDGRLRIGYIGSSNWVNEKNLGEFVALWSGDPDLPSGSELYIAGGVCDTLSEFVSDALLKQAAPTMFGRVSELGQFFSRCDLIINPERGGTGIKIKTLEAMAHGMPILTTSSGAVGIGSTSRFHQAKDFSDLVKLISEVVVNPALLREIRKATVDVFDAYFKEHKGRLEDLLGPPDPSANGFQLTFPSNGAYKGPNAVNIPDYVKRNASDDQLDLFKEFISRTEILGKRVLEIGSDYHLASARLFMANGAREVLATNSGDWKSAEPLPAGIEFRVCDLTDVDFHENRFDIVYGASVLEHISDLEKFCEAIKKLLQPSGVAYLHGHPLWPGPTGHRVLYQPNSKVDWRELFAKRGEKTTEALTYTFSNPERNPIPHWAHLAMEPDALAALLVEKGLPRADASEIVTQIFNIDGSRAGACSNFISASQVLRTLDKHFDTRSEQIISQAAPNQYFSKARETYSEQDLRTLGLNIWLRHKHYADDDFQPTHTPKVSIVIPFYNVECFIDECLSTVVNQDYLNLEILLIDDASPDGSRAVVNRFAMKDARIRLLTHETNLGLGPARNTGVASATGAYLMFLDSDDLLSSPQAVSILVAKAESSGCKVVIGSCQRLMPDGQILDYDRDFDRSHGGKPGDIVDGEAAYLGASFIPGSGYVPMRAWGTLIDRILYNESGLHFPAAEHEDLPHTPFLYYYAKKVFYLPDIVVTYRQRSESISNARWSAGIIRRYVTMWRQIKTNIAKFGLQARAGDAAIKTAEHMLWKLRHNGLETGAEPTAISALEEMLSDAKGKLNESLLFYTMDSLRGILDFQKNNVNLYRRLTRAIDPSNLIKYYGNRVADTFIDYGPLPFSENATTASSTAHAVIQPESSPLDQNDVLVAKIMHEYRQTAADHVKDFPSMLTEGDKALYFHAGKTCRFEGAIVDAGCFVGGTTICLIQGLMNNPLAVVHPEATNKLIRVYDLFQIDDDYILEHLQKNYPERNFNGQTRFLDVFRENLADNSEFLDVRPGDVTRVGYPDKEPIEVLGVDLCKALSITDFVVREFFPRLLPGSIVIQQDFIHEFHPHIHLSMLKLEDHFEKYVEIKWGGSVAYRCVKPVTQQIILERFGVDSSWYGHIEQNAALLRKLEREMLYDENRWTMVLTLAIYYWANSCPELARLLYQEACARFPEFQPAERTTTLIGA